MYEYIKKFVDTVFLVAPFYFGWIKITTYSPKGRTRVFWTMNILAGIIILCFVILQGNNISWGVFFLLGIAVVVGFYIGEQYVINDQDWIERRYIISFTEDVLLFADALTIASGGGWLVERFFVM